MLAHHRYNFDPTATDPTSEDPKVFEAVYEAVGRDWTAALGVFRAAAASPDDPFDYLRNWLADHGN
jgi:hypothetical protein